MLAGAKGEKVGGVVEEEGNNAGGGLEKAGEDPDSYNGCV